MTWNIERILADFGFVQIRWYTIWFVTGLLCVWHIVVPPPTNDGICLVHMYLSSLCSLPWASL